MGNESMSLTLTSVGMVGRGNMRVCAGREGGIRLAIVKVNRELGAAEWRKESVVPIRHCGCVMGGLNKLSNSLQSNERAEVFY